MAIELAYLCNHRFRAVTRPDRYRGIVSIADLCPECRPRHKVEKADIDGFRHATGRTEGELNGWEYRRA